MSTTRLNTHTHTNALMHTRNISLHCDSDKWYLFNYIFKGLWCIVCKSLHCGWMCVCVCVCVWAVYGTDIGELSNIRNVPQIKISILLYSIMTWLVPLLSYTVRSSTHSIHDTYMMHSIHDTWYHLQLGSHLRWYFYTITLLIFLSVFQSSLSTFSNPRKEYRHLLNVYIMLYVCVLKCKGVCVCVCVSGS